MGLDGVEIIMEIEDVFNISISDEEAQKCLTPRILIDLVKTKINIEEGDERCLSQKSFHLCRGSFMELKNIKRGLFRPKSLLKEIIPERNRAEFWRSWQTKMGLATFPTLARPAWLQIALWFLPIGSSAGFFCLTKNIYLAILGAICLGLVGYILTSKFPRNSFLMSGVQRVGDVVDYIVRNHPDKVKMKIKVWRPGEVRTVVRKIISDQLGIKKFNDDANFVKDLGIN